MMIDKSKDGGHYGKYIYYNICYMNDHEIFTDIF